MKNVKKAFQNIKEYLVRPPVLSSPPAGQTIGVYLVASEITVSAVLFIDGEEKQTLFIRKKLTGPETLYSKNEKIVLAMVHAPRRLKSNSIGLRKILTNAQKASRLVEYASYLSAYGIVFERRPSEKGHVLASLLSHVPMEDSILG